MKETVTPPEHLTGDALQFWQRVQRDYGVTDPAGLRLLKLASEALQTAETARIALQQHGLTFDDRWGAPRPRPEARLQSVAMQTFRGLVRELRLDPLPLEKKR